MTEFEYLLALLLLLIGFNIGFYESDKGLMIKDIKLLLQKIKRKAPKSGKK